MARCKRCGKKGLLLKLDSYGLCAECAAAANQELNRIIEEQETQLSKLNEELEHQDKLLDIALKARDNYSKDGDAEKAITELEKAIVEAKPPLLRASGHTVFLIDLYKKTGQNDKAWGLLNSCLLDAAMYEGKERLAQDRVRIEMAKILKSEKNYSAAVEMYMLKYLYDVSRGTEASKAHDEEQFRKNIKPCISKLKWDEETVSDLIAIVNEAGKENSLAEAERIVTEQYRAYLNEHELGS